MKFGSGRNFRALLAAGTLALGVATIIAINASSPSNAAGAQWHAKSNQSEGLHTHISSISSLVSNFQSFAGSQSVNGAPFDLNYVSTSNGPSVMQAISGSASGATPNVIAFEAVGNFVAMNAKVPAGASFPTGTVLTEIVDATTGAIEGWGISNQQVNLAPYGTVQVVNAVK